MAHVTLTGGPLGGQQVKAVTGGQITHDGCLYVLQDDGTWAYHSGEPDAKPATSRRGRPPKLVDESDS